MARCIALIGMIATHTLASTTQAGDTTFLQQVAGGRSSALFAVLAGASMALMSGRTHPVTGRPAIRVASRLAVRALIVTFIGLLLGELDTSVAVILTYYGLLFLLGIPFLQLKAAPLAVLAGLGLVTGPLVSHVVRGYLPATSYDSPTISGLFSPFQLLSELAFTGYYPAATWLPYLVAGMALGRTDLSGRRIAWLLAIGGQVLAGAAKLTSAILLSLDHVRDLLLATYPGPSQSTDLDFIIEHGLYGVTPTGTWWWLAVSGPHSGTPFDLAHTIGTSVSVIGACLLVVPFAQRLFAVVFGAGEMTLTLYSLHVVLLIPQAWSEDGPATFLKHTGLVLLIGAAYRLLNWSGPLERMVGALATAFVRERERDRAPDGELSGDGGGQQ